MGVPIARDGTCAVADLWRLVETGRRLGAIHAAAISSRPRRRWSRGSPRLGLRFHARGGSKGRYVLPEAYAAGHEAGGQLKDRQRIGAQAQGGAKG